MEERNVCNKIENIDFDTNTSLYVYRDIPIVVRNASKSFHQRETENRVLVDLNLTVSKGKIYGLLGPSGCGKTTLLRCIIGRLRLDKGDVLTFGERPGTPESTIPGPRLGYMPQEDALDGIMTIKEILYYFGCMLCVPRKQILEKIAFLVDFLKLPSEKTRFSSLSGGQKRRVSFAVSLIHDAELLILDEPTVGVDPILKQNIWDYLIKLVRGGMKTVIITTHYIEEARRASHVGMMFEGRVLAEGDPNHLISHYRRNTLEDVFLHVCVNQKKADGRLTGGGCGDGGVVTGTASVPLLAGEGSSANPGTTTDKLFSSFHCETMQSNIVRDNFFYRAVLEYCPDVRLSRLRAVVYRGFIQLFRYPGLLLLIMASPSFQIALCGFALGRPITSIEVGIVNEDTGHSASRYLSHVDSEVIQQANFTSWEVARQAVLDGKLWGVLKFGQNFSNALLDRYNKTPYVDQRTIMESNVNVSLDGTSFLFAETIRFVLLDAYKKFVSELLAANNMDPELASIPIVTDEPVFGKGDNPYSFFIMPSFITGSSFFAQMGLAIVGLFLDKEGGKLERVYIAGVTPFELVFGFLVIQLFVMIAEVVFMLVTALVIFKFSNEGSIVLVIVLCMLQGMCGTSLGLLIAASVNRFTSTSIISMTVIVTSVAFGGFMWPVEATAVVVRYVCLVSPFAMAANAMRNIMYRRWTLMHPDVSNGFGITVVWLLVFLLLSVVILRTKKST